MPPTGIRYRPATARDATIVAELVVSGFATYRAFAPREWQPRATGLEESELYDRLSRGDVRARLALSTTNGALAGFISWSPAFTRTDPPEVIAGRAHLSALFVAQDHWGSGLATGLLAWSVDGMRDSGFASAQLWTPSGHSRARSFYEREGWHALPDSEMHSPELSLDLVMYEVDLG
jgi:GNAT superfamily N-acetyltransferase